MANFSQFFSDESDLYKELTTRTTAPITNGQLLQINTSATRIDGVDQTIQQVTGVAQTVPPGQVIYNTTEVYINNTVNNITAAADVDLATVVGLVLLEFTPSVSTDDTVQTQVVTSPANGIDNIIVGSGSLWDVPSANSGDIDDLGSGTRLNFSTSDPIALLKETAESQTDIAEFIGTFTSALGASFYMGNVDSDDTYATTAPTPVAKYTYDLSLTTDTTVSILITDTTVDLSISAASAIDDQTTIAGSTEYSTDLQQVITSFANSVTAHAGADSPTTYSIFYRGATGTDSTFLGNVTSVTTTAGSEEISIDLAGTITTFDITAGDILSVQLVSFVYSTESSTFSVSGGVGFEGFSDGLLYPIGSDGNGNIIPFVNDDGAGNFTELTDNAIPLVSDGTFADSAIVQTSVDNEGTVFNTVSITSVGEGGAQNSLNVNGTTISTSGAVSAVSLALQTTAVADDALGGGSAPEALIYKDGFTRRITIGAVGEAMVVTDTNPLSLQWTPVAGINSGNNTVPVSNADSTAFVDSVITQASVNVEGSITNTITIASGEGEGAASNQLNVNGTTINSSGNVSAVTLGLQNAAVADDSFGGGSAPDALIYRNGAIQRINIGAVGEVLTVVDNNPLSLEWAAPAGGVDGITHVDGGGSLTYQPAVPFTGTVEQNQVGGALTQDSDLVIASTSSAFSGAVASGSAWSTVSFVHFNNTNSGSFWERTSNAASASFVQGITTDSFILLYTDDSNWAVVSPISTTQVSNSLNISIEASMGVTPTIGNQITIGFVPSATYPFPSDEIRIAGDLTVTGGIMMTSPDGTNYRITVANGGTLTVTAV